MAKFLLAILLLVAGVKLFADSRGDGYKYESAKLAEQSEEEKEDVKVGKVKYNIEDSIYYHDILDFYILFALSKAATQSWKQDIYTSFVDRPTSPPPNIL